MFFARQKTNQCGLHAIQNVLKSAKITSEDMHMTCQEIHANIGDAIHNHESFGGDWSVQAVLQTLVRHGYDVTAAVSSKKEREWVGPPIEELLTDKEFRGILLHQPLNRHFTCLRPEDKESQRKLYYIDSQSSGPVQIPTNLAARRCLATAYMWEPYIVKGPEMEHVKPEFEEACHELRPRKRARRPSSDFMKAWYSLANSGRSESTTQIEKQKPSGDNPPVSSSPTLEDDDK